MGKNNLNNIPYDLENYNTRDGAFSQQQSLFPAIEKKIKKKGGVENI